MFGNVTDLVGWLPGSRRTAGFRVSVKSVGLTDRVGRDVERGEGTVRREPGSQPTRSVTLPNIGVPHYIGVPQRVTYP